jgi:NTE family protein
MAVNGNGFGGPLSASAARFGDRALDLVTRILSPYQFNPLDYNPLRRSLRDAVDFERLRRQVPLRLFLAATDVASGRPRIFETSELTLEVVLASACLPYLHHAIKVDDRHYWDGGFSANPPVVPLVCGCQAEDSLIVQLLPGAGAALPTEAPEIQERVGAIVFNAPLRREMELIERCRELATGGWFVGNRRIARLRRHRFHLIDATADTVALAAGSRLAPRQELIEELHRAGRAAAALWLQRSFAAVGVSSTVDLAEAFL